MRRRDFLAGAAVAAFAAPGFVRAEDGGRWWRVETTSFTLYGEMPPKTLQDLARDLEDFDDLLRSLHGVREKASRPLPIYIPAGDSGLERVWPGIDQRIGGFYSPTVGEVFAVMNGEGGGLKSRPVLFHEYTHHFMSQSAPAAYPAWLREGYAEYFMRTRFTPDMIEIGGTSPRINWIRREGWRPYAEILGGKPLDGGVYDSGAFYAQSWILTHYMLSDPARLARLAAYASAVAQGGDPVEEMAKALGAPVASLPKTLTLYMDQLPGRRIPRTSPAIPPSAVTRLPPSADALLLENQRLKRGVPKDQRPAALAMIRERAARFPGDRLADLTLARAENDFGDRDRAQAILKARIQRDPRDVDALQMLGWSCMLAARADPAQRDALMRQARDWFGQGFKVDPNQPLLLYDFAMTRRGEPGYPSDNVLNVLLKAEELAPQVVAFRMAAADGLMRRERFDEAAALLAPIFNNPHAGPEVAQAKARFEAAKARKKPSAGDTDEASGATGG